MKGRWITVGALLVILLGVVAVAEARGGQADATWTCPMQGGSAAVAGGPAAMGEGFGRGGNRMGRRGPGMMGGGGPGMMRGGGPGTTGSANCNGENYDPAAMLANHTAMLTQHEALLESLKKQLTGTEDEQRIAWLNQKIEWQQLMIAYMKGKLPVIAALPEDEWLDGAIALTAYDIQFFSTASSADPQVANWIANRLARAEERLSYLEDQKEL